MATKIKKTFRLGPQQREIIKLQVNRAGRITASVSWSGGPICMAVILNGPGQVGYYARENGTSPVTLVYSLSSQDIARGNEWRISVVNFSGRTVSLVNAIVELPGSEVSSELPPKFERLRKDFFLRLKAVTPRISSADLIVRTRDARVVNIKMAEAQAILKKAKIKSVAAIGDLSITRDIILKPGIFQPRHFRGQGYASDDEVRLYGALAHTILFSPILSGEEILQEEAVLIGKKVDFGNSKVIISESVKKLLVIAQEVKAGPNAGITWQGLNVPPTPKTYTHPQRQHGRNFGSYSPRVQTSASRLHSPSGSHGGTGDNGANGYDGNLGEPPPTVEIITLAFSGVPKINLRGTPGGPGENGQKGENGGHGAKGLHSECAFLWCDRGAGWGGNGGDGGPGGTGGDGGKGGPGGTIYIYSTYEGLRKFGKFGFVPIISGGLGGPGGKGGAGGDEGIGGDPGDPSVCRGRDCDPEPLRKGKNGTTGKSGSDGVSYNIPIDENYGPPGKIFDQEITEDDFQKYLTKPYLLWLRPFKGAPGTTVKAYGFNLAEGDEIVFGKKVINSRFLTEDQMIFTIPGNAAGSFHEVKIKRGKTYTNSLSFEVTPIITNIFPPGGAPGTEVTITGRAFMPGANVLFGNTEIVPSSSIRTQLKFEIPAPGGDISWIREEGDTLKVAVYNPYPSKETSNQVQFQLTAVYGLNFDPREDAWSFSQIIGKGVPSWDTLCDTFGEGEVVLSGIFQPLTFWPFFGFYKWFGTGPYGLCTGMATSCLERFRSGLQNTSSFTMSQVIREITVAFGHMLGIDQLKRFNNQVENGISSVRETFEIIENFFKHGTDLRQAPILMFLPSGTIWDMDRLKKAHTVLPYKITYEKESGKFPARVYIYNHWYPGNTDDYVRFFEKDGVLHFQYKTPGGALKYDTDHGYTLGTSSLDFMLLSDADMPISLIEGALLLLDTVFSPVNVRIENEEGKMIGYKEGKIHLNLPGSLFIPFAPNCYVLPSGYKYKRIIEGKEEGTYSYGITSSEKLNIYLKDVPTKTGAVDILSMSSDTLAFVFQSIEEKKKFNLVVTKKIGEETRIWEINEIQIEKNERILFWMDNNLDEFGFTNVETQRSKNINIRLHRHKEDLKEMRLTIPEFQIHKGHYLKLTVKNWKILSMRNVQTSSSSEKTLIPIEVREQLWD